MKRVVALIIITVAGCYYDLRTGQRKQTLSLTYGMSKHLIANRFHSLQRGGVQVLFTTFMDR